MDDLVGGQVGGGDRGVVDFLADLEPRAADLKDARASLGHDLLHEGQETGELFGGHGCAKDSDSY